MTAIIMMHGLPCTGKSFLAEKISKYIANTVVLKTIDFRDAYGSGAVLFDETNIETKKDKDESYRLLCSAAKLAIKEGKTPILDATFHKKYRREWVYELAKELDASVVVINPVCDEKKVLECLQNRSSEDSKDAFLKSTESYTIMKSQFETINEEVLVKTVRPDEHEDFVRWLRNILS